MYVHTCHFTFVYVAEDKLSCRLSNHGQHFRLLNDRSLLTTQPNLQQLIRDFWVEHTNRSRDSSTWIDNPDRSRDTVAPIRHPEQTTGLQIQTRRPFSAVLDTTILAFHRITSSRSSSTYPLEAPLAPVTSTPRVRGVTLTGKTKPVSETFQRFNGETKQ